MKQLFKVIFYVLLTGSSLPAFSDDFPDKPYPPRLVNDYTGFLSDTERKNLEQKLVAFDRETSTQIAVVIVESFKGYDKADYAVQLARKWGIGQEGKNNGILILIKPKTSDSKGDVFIATGYGLEGVVPDAIAKRIVENEMLPAFRNGNYSEGINNSVDILMDLTRGEFTAEEYNQRTENTENAVPDIIVFVIFVIFIIIFSIIGKVRAARQYSIGHNIPFWLALMMLSGSRNTHRGSFGDFSSGSGGFGSGGGFGGFGGGSFGGGGAGGSW